MKTIDAVGLAQVLFEQTTEALFLFDLETDLIHDANPQAERLTGYTRTDLRNQSLHQMLNRNQAGKNGNRSPSEKNPETPFLDEIVLRSRKEGVAVPVKVHFHRVQVGGETMGLARIRDLRETRHFQEQLRQNRSEFQRLINRSIHGIWSAVFHPETGWHWKFFSPTVTRITGQSAEYFQKGWEAWISLAHPTDQVRLRKLVENLGRHGFQMDTVFRLADEGRGPRWLRWVVDAEPNVEGGIRFDGSLTDITERIQALEQLAASERKYRQLVETSQDLIFSIDTQARITFVNRKAMLDLFGYEPEEVVGRPFTDFLHPDFLRKDLEAFQKVLGGEPLEGYVSTYIRKDGRELQIRMNAVPIVDANGQIQGTTGTCVDVTQAVLSERALRESEERFQSFMNHSSVVAFMKDNEGRMVYVNQAFEKIFHTTLENIRGKSDFELWTLPIAEKLRQTDQEILAGNQPVECWEKVPTPDGRMHEWLVLKFPFRDSSGRLFLGGIALDQTESLEAERALRASEERYRLLFERNLAGVFRSTRGGALQDCNDSFARMFGFSSRKEALEAEALSFYFDPAHREKVLEVLREQQYLTNQELLLRRRDGQPIWVLVNVNIHADQEGNAILEGTLVDITPQKTVEGALRASEAKYRSLIENLEQRIFLKDRNLCYQAANQNFCRVLGITEEALLGRTDEELYSPEEADRCRAEDQRVLEGRPVQSEEEVKLQGQPRIIRSMKTPVHDDRGQVVGVLGILWDVTDQRAVESQLRHVQKMDAIGQLAGGIAHDFNNLLTVILGNLSFVLRQQAVEGDLGEMIRNAEQAGLRAAEMTQQLLDFSRRSMLRAEPVNLNLAIEETSRLLRRTIDPRIEVVLQPRTDLWPVKADSGLIHQLLMNLMINARDAMPQGGTLTLETDHFFPDAQYLATHLEAREGEFVRFRVCDTGHGMPPEVRQRIFEPFFSTKEKGKGTGLGLATVFGIVKQHQGWIVCESAPGQGTVMEVFLPRHHQAAVPDPMREEMPAAEGSETILMVDDEFLIRQMGNMVLRRFGYQVLLAEDGKKAIDIFKEKHGEIDLVLLDGNMPRLSGRDTLRHLVAIDPNVRVLFSSGFTADHLDLNEFPQVIGFMHKPYRVEDLATKVRSLLDQIERERK